jgi:hypothetical protein
MVLAQLPQRKENRTGNETKIRPTLHEGQLPDATRQPVECARSGLPEAKPPGFMQTLHCTTS